MRSTYALILLFLFGFAAVHTAKMIRLYLVLMERKIAFRRFVLLYLKTTFVNLIVPFKIGEVFRVYCISKETKKFQIGILSVLMDRFFDTVVLLLFLLPVQIFVTGHISGVAVVLFAAVLFLFLLYLEFQPVYTYLNRYIILNKKSNRSMIVLKGLEILWGWYEDAKELVTGRSPLIFFFSCVGWLLELGVLKIFSWVIGEDFGIAGFTDYIETIFLAGSSRLLETYTAVGAVLLAISAVLGSIYVQKQRRNEVKNEAGNCNL